MADYHPSLPYIRNNDPHAGYHPSLPYMRNNDPHADYHPSLSSSLMTSMFEKIHVLSSSSLLLQPQDMHVPTNIHPSLSQSWTGHNIIVIIL